MRNIITANSEYGWELFFVVLIAWVAGARTCHSLYASRGESFSG